ncbi:MAG: adenosylcobinamide-GDP ribazoletransferase [Cereibacter sp.]
MTRRDSWRPQVFDVLAALGLLTRLPLNPDGARAQARGAAAAWAWPLAGVAVGLLGAASGGLALWLGVAPGAAAALAIAAQMVVTGALHEDGLADSADGLWGGWDTARRLAIMKDSRIGTFGVLALVLVTLLRWVALAGLFATGTPWGALAAAGALSRVPMVVLMAALPNARGSGLAHGVGRPEGTVVAMSCATGLACGFLALGPTAFSAAFWVGGVCLAVGLVARAKIGGQTGDILGASQQISEAVVLTLIAASLRP